MPRAVAPGVLRMLAPNSMNVTLLVGPPAQLAWDAPNGAVTVACAVFVASRASPHTPGPSATDNNAQLEQIVNFDACAVGTCQRV